MLRLDLTTLSWSLVDNYGDIPGVRMGYYPLFFVLDSFLSERFVWEDTDYYALVTKDTLRRSIKVKS